MELPSSLTTRMHYQHKSLVDLIDGLNEEQFRREVIPGKWSVFENIVHLQTYQHVFIDRINQLLKGNNPLFPSYTAEADPAFHENCGKTSREIMHDLLTTRKEITSGVMALSETDFLKTAIHPVFGKLTLNQWLNFFLLHEAHHLFTIFKLAATLRKDID